MDKSDKQEIYTLTEDESVRISVLKVWMTIMVVFLHSYAVNIAFSEGNVVFEVPKWLEIFKFAISRVVSSCAVPGFFMISSVLLYKRTFCWRKNIQKKVRTLMIPYAILNTFWICFYFVVQNIPVLSPFFSNSDNYVAGWKAIDWIDAYIGYTGYPLLYPLWFVRDLFVMNLLAFVIKKLVDKFPKTIFVILSVIWIFNIPTYIFCIDNRALVFWVYGYYIVKYGKHMKDVDSIPKVKLVVLYIATIVADVLCKGLLFHSPVHQMGIIVGICFWIKCTTKINNENVKKFLFFMSKYSFGIYLFHESNMTILKKLCAKILPMTPVFQLIQYIGIPIIIIICCVLFCVVLNKTFPKIYSVITGDRVRL